MASLICKAIYKLYWSSCTFLSWNLICRAFCKMSWILYYSRAMVEFIWFAVICIICLLYPLVPAADCCAALLELGNHSPHHPTPKVRAFWLWMKYLLNIRISPITHAHILSLYPHDATEWVLPGHLLINLYEVMMFQNIKPKQRYSTWPQTLYDSLQPNTANIVCVPCKALMQLKLFLCYVPSLLLWKQCSRLNSLVMWIIYIDPFYDFTSPRKWFYSK